MLSILSFDPSKKGILVQDFLKFPYRVIFVCWAVWSVFQERVHFKENRHFWGVVSISYDFIKQLVSGGITSGSGVGCNC